MHLFALALAPIVVHGFGSADHALLVCVTSIRADVPFEDSCVLVAGEHPFIEHASYVDYRFTRLERVKHLEQCMASGAFKAKEPCSPDLLRKLLTGALASNRISREFKVLIQRGLGL